VKRFFYTNTNDLRGRLSSATMSGMSTNRQSGSANILLVSLISAVVLLLSVAGFGTWAFNSRQDYKNHSDTKSAVAAAAAVKVSQASDAIKYAEEAKNPLKAFVGPGQYGSITVQYPKTWSGYIVQNNATPLDAYFQPNVVTDITSPNISFALRIQVVNQTYAQVMATFSSKVTTKQVTATPYSFPKVKSVIGSRIDGQISIDNQGSIIVLPLRNLALLVSTQSQAFEPDFNNIILPNLSFSP